MSKRKNVFCEIIAGSFKGKEGLLQGQFLDGLYWVKTGMNTQVMVTLCQIKILN